ncbi:hypothetical protein WJX73_007843 [Symbiochloris irregularis]|uniref:Ubiquitin carboxyl-terminal hydrolase n=1 Tax=Symbiochloris irregularis TaxID=706552 RepID=A0AAW1P4G1_9CHLO
MSEWRQRTHSSGREGQSAFRHDQQPRSSDRSRRDQPGQYPHQPRQQGPAPPAWGQHNSRTADAGPSASRPAAEMTVAEAPPKSSAWTSRQRSGAAASTGAKPSENSFQPASIRQGSIQEEAGRAQDPFAATQQPAPGSSNPGSTRATPANGTAPAPAQHRQSRQEGPSSPLPEAPAPLRPAWKTAIPAAVLGQSGAQASRMASGGASQPSAASGSTASSLDAVLSPKRHGLQQTELSPSLPAASAPASSHGHSAPNGPLCGNSLQHSSGTARVAGAQRGGAGVGPAGGAEALLVRTAPGTAQTLPGRSRLAIRAEQSPKHGALADEVAAANTSLRLQPRGLVNTGNLCFMNSILQALMGGGIFCYILQTLKAAAPQLPESQYPLLHAFSELAKSFAVLAAEPVPNGTASSDQSGAKKDQGSRAAAVLGGQPLMPSMMFNLLGTFNPNNARPSATTAVGTPPGKPPTMAERLSARLPTSAQREQEDAHEFFNFLVDETHKELLRLRSAHASALGDSGAAQMEEMDDEEGGWKRQGRGRKRAVTRGHTVVQGGETLATAMFGGATRSEVRTAGVPASATLQPFTHLQLDILPPHVNSLADAFEFLIAAEDIEGYKLDNGRIVTASKAQRLHKLPRILVLHLKRFTVNLAGFAKLHKPVHFDAILQLKRGWLSDGCQWAGRGTGKGKLPEYDLMATVSHHGRVLSSGHYTADVRQPDLQWLRFDDTQVSLVPPNRVLDERSAYLLFYKLRM